MTLDEFVSQMKKHISNFEKEWKMNQGVNPDDWPDEMFIGDWEDQFNTFVENDYD